MNRLIYLSFFIVLCPFPALPFFIFFLSFLNSEAFPSSLFCVFLFFNRYSNLFFPFLNILRFFRIYFARFFISSIFLSKHFLSLSIKTIYTFSFFLHGLFLNIWSLKTFCFFLVLIFCPSACALRFSLKRIWFQSVIVLSILLLVILIIQLLREWPPGFGGVERVAHELGVFGEAMSLVLMPSDMRINFRIPSGPLPPSTFEGYAGWPSPDSSSI